MANYYTTTVHLCQNVWSEWQQSLWRHSLPFWAYEEMVLVTTKCPFDVFRSKVPTTTTTATTITTTATTTTTALLQPKGEIEIELWIKKFHIFFLFHLLRMKLSPLEINLILARLLSSRYILSLSLSHSFSAHTLTFSPLLLFKCTRTHAHARTLSFLFLFLHRNSDLSLGGLIDW